MYLPSFRLDGKKAIVTGAGRGISRALASALAEAGADVAILSRTISDPESTAELIHSHGRQSLIIPTDLTKREDASRAVGIVKEECGSIDILINNAGMNIRSKALDVADEEWETIMNTNLKSAFMMAQETGKVMKEQEAGGRIISVAPLRAMSRSGLASCMRQARPRSSR